MSFENDHDFDPQLISNILGPLFASRPDLFTPVLMAYLINENVVKTILKGDTPFLVHHDTKVGNTILLSMFNRKQLQEIRKCLSSGLGVKIPDFDIDNQTYTIADITCLPGYQENLPLVDAFGVIVFPYSGSL
jgi:hypothetical protein